MKLRVNVEGHIYEVDVEVLEEHGGAYQGPPPAYYQQPAPAPAPAAPAPAAPPAAAPAPAAPAPSAPAAGGPGDFPSPIAGTVRAIHVNVGDSVEANQEIMVLEAMKMETSIYSPQAGKIKSVNVKSGDAVQSGQSLLTFE